MQQQSSDAGRPGPTVSNYTITVRVLGPNTGDTCRLPWVVSPAVCLPSPGRGTTKGVFAMQLRSYRSCHSQVQP
jgi:hypothetical protein